MANWTLWLLFWFKFFSFFSSFLFFFSFLFCFCVFIRFERKRRGCGLMFKIFDFLFNSKFISLFSFCFEKGGASLCLWGFLCPVCLELQGRSYSPGLSYSSSENPVTESQFERYPPWSCRGFDRYEAICLFFVSCCCCLCGLFAGAPRHRRGYDHDHFEYYCSSQPCCGCCHGISIEDCLVGHFCCCCSIIQVTMAVNEHFRMQSKVEGDLNIKCAHWKERKNYWQNKKGQFWKNENRLSQKECYSLHTCSIWFTKSKEQKEGNKK